MVTVVIKVPSAAKGKLSAYVKELGGNIVSKSPAKKSSKKAKLLNEIKQGLKEVKEINKDKSMSYSMSHLLD